MERQVYLEDVPYEEARQAFLKPFAGRLMPPETLPVTECCGRVTAAPIFARISSPHYHAAAMDGVAVAAKVTFGASETSPVRLTIGEDAFWVDTGDPLPPGTNAVIMVEDLHELPSGELEIIKAVSPWENVRLLGEDMVQTELILPANHRLRPVDLGAILAGGVTEIAVRRRPRVAILPTGTELVPPGKEPAPGEIIEFNSTIFAAQVREWGGEPVVHPITPDDYGLIKARVEQAAAEADVILVGAGSSAGSEDFSARIIGELGSVLVHGAATRPGKPVILGMVQGKPTIGVPGYPASAVLVLDLYLKPLLSSLLGLPSEEPPKVTARLARNITSPLGVDEFVRVKLGAVGPNLVATPLARGAALTTSLVRADGVLKVPRGSEGITAGSKVEVYLLRGETEIRGTVVAIGSHDLTLDIIANLLKEKYPKFTLSSAHVGSLGGLLALRRGEAHLAGTHLLDETTGEYNIPYLKRYLPGEEVYLITLVYREQGLLVLPGNPKGIKTLADLTRPDVTFINRQKGAGTRVLLDLALKEEGIDPHKIQGYEREEYTHTAVAAAVKSGAADVGLGVLSAARALGLDFIPWRAERYDLAVPAAHLDHPGVRAILDIIESREFKEQVTALGGYDVRDTGKIQWPRKGEEDARPAGTEN
ncbi:MAG: molybdopterin molybdotransferase [Bacillota bacterium]|jgi:putative molybdopterin biosynthesis protein|nr:molybdopterin molybdotransferase [Bacillota bacterium]MDK2855401.1 molybdopterin molybdotransferase [Bacillota bacterium]MDK2924465.1 molybdopterin molybdotransferase [Bacillota bacterium]